MEKFLTFSCLAVILLFCLICVLGSIVLKQAQKISRLEEHDAQNEENSSVSEQRKS